MSELTEQAVLDFSTYPPVGSDDWQYAFQAAQVRTLEIQMLTRAALLDMTNAQNFEQAADLLSGTEYALPQGAKDIAQAETILQQRRTALRERRLCNCSGPETILRTSGWLSDVH